jgi:hypothetical protein
MRLYSYSSDAYQDALRFLRSWGIRPTPGQDEKRYFLAFDFPKSWPRNKRRRFQAALRKQAAPTPSSSPEPDPAESSCAFCESTPATCLTDCPCGHWLPACTGCLAAGRVSPCTGCGSAPTPRTWPVPTTGSSEDRVRTIRAMYRAHFAAITGYIRRCDRSLADNDKRISDAIPHVVVLAIRLYDLECVGVGIGVTDLEPLDGAEAEFRRAAVAVGAHTRTHRASAPEMDALIGKLLAAVDRLVAAGDHSQSAPASPVDGPEGDVRAAPNV